eukprot:TRINITY_DN1242_c1_g4_i1.p1 TRINITY_DN1242_c1_g4~~TRINITY_DN1242_c1_g4_i1.p1  ORF type:complete len:586 (+),score=84.03 TRINITY_DN1242_c1_g4_i1:37-1794(+)
MCMDHERIHIETSSVLFRQLPLGSLSKPPTWPSYAPTVSTNDIKNEFISLPDKVVEMGKSLDFPTYGWDNEYGKRVVTVPAFRATKYLITNREYLKFVEAGGYDNNVYWSEEGWSWRCFIKPKHPLFWVKFGDTWKLRTIWELIDMPWDWPVVTNYLESEAYANWRGNGTRLITEAEWHVMRGEISVRGTHKEELLLEEETFPGNTMLRYGSESCVDQFPPSLAGFYDVFGNVWQWTLDHNDGFSGFKIHPLYFDFSTPCFDSRHNIIQGGSYMSTGCQATVFGRFAFRRHFFQHAGIRLAQTITPINKDLYDIRDNPHEITVNHWINTSNRYELPSTLNEYLLYAYGDSKLNLNGYDSLKSTNLFTDSFPLLCAKICGDYIRSNDKKITGLDIGCGVGRSTFELTRFCDSVTGIDSSHSFIQTCNKLKKQGEYPFSYVEEGKIVKKSKATVDPLLDRSRCTFILADVCNLNSDIGTFDVVLCGNLIDRVADPKKCLDTLPQLVNKNGIMVFTSPFTWTEQYTHCSSWLGGYMKDGYEVKTDEVIKSILSPHFEFLKQMDIPMLFKEHNRKYQLCIPQLSVWKRK